MKLFRQRCLFVHSYDLSSRVIKSHQESSRVIISHQESLRVLCFATSKRHALVILIKIVYNKSFSFYISKTFFFIQQTECNSTRRCEYFLPPQWDERFVIFVLLFSNRQVRYGMRNRKVWDIVRHAKRTSILNMTHKVDNLYTSSLLQ